MLNKKFDIQGHFTVKCPAVSENDQQRTGGLPYKMSGEAQMNFEYSAQKYWKRYQKLELGQKYGQQEVKLHHFLCPPFLKACVYFFCVFLLSDLNF